ncbi:MAG: DUF4345 domain-containing protein [Pseudomonadota bacterium]
MKPISRSKALFKGKLNSPHGTLLPLARSNLMLDLDITAIDSLNAVLMIATIVFGAIGYLKPRFTLEKLDLQTDGSPLGLSEIRAANGALFVGLGAAALFIATPIAFAMVGFAYAGAALAG